MIKKIKSELNITSIELAKMLGVTPPTLRNWEKNESWPLWALRKCDVLNCNKNEVIVDKIKELLNED